MPDNPAKEAFINLLSYLEQLETQAGALLQFLKDNGVVTDEKLGPYLEQASKAADVKSRAMRARFDFLFDANENKRATDVNPQAPSEPAVQASAESQEGNPEAEGPNAESLESRAKEAQPKGAGPQDQDKRAA